MKNSKIKWILPFLWLVTIKSYSDDLVRTATTDGSFKTLVAAVEASGMIQTLKNDGPYTVFAPTDAAFAKLPQGKWRAITKDKAKLAEVLAHHIVPGKITVAEVKPGMIKTVQGDELKIASDNGKITLGNASVIQSDLKADNGIIQAIDTVLLPD